MHKAGDILRNRSRDTWFLVIGKTPYENNTYRYTLLDLRFGKYTHSFAPKGLYKKVA